MIQVLSLPANPPAITKMRQEFGRSVERARRSVEQLALIKAEGDLASAQGRFAEAKKNLEGERDRLDGIIGELLDGELSIESGWRAYCDYASQKRGKVADEMELVTEFFDQHLAILHSFQDDSVIQSMEEYGCTVPNASEIGPAIERTEQYRDRVLDRWPLTKQEFAYRFPVDVEEVLYISPYAYIRSVFNIVWSAIRHPFSTTYIDLSTGDSVTPGKHTDEAA